MVKSRAFTILLFIFAITLSGCSFTAETEEPAEVDQQTQEVEDTAPPLPEELQQALEFLDVMHIHKNTAKAKGMWKGSPNRLDRYMGYSLKPGSIMMASKIRDIDKWYVYVFIPYPQYSEGSLMRIMIEKRENNTFVITDLDDRKKFFKDFAEFSDSSTFKDLGNELYWTPAELG